MSKHCYGANSEMLLLLAWLSTLNLQEQARKDRQERPWKDPQKPYGETWQPVFPEQLIHEQVTLALQCFQRDPVYGPVFEVLVRYRLTSIDFSLVAWSIELQELADPSAGLLFSDHPSSSEHQQRTEFADETDAFWRVAISHTPLADHLHRLSNTWDGDGCRGACELRSFFGWYLELIQRPLQMPFFLVELVRKSLLKINWHRIAANILGIPYPACHCINVTPQVHGGATAEYLGELFKVTGDEILSLGQQLADPERTQALLLADLCRETTRAMRLLLINSKEHS